MRATVAGSPSSSPNLRITLTPGVIATGIGSPNLRITLTPGVIAAGIGSLNLRITLAPGVSATGIGTPNLHYYDTFHIFFEYVAVSVATAHIRVHVITRVAPQ